MFTIARDWLVKDDTLSERTSLYPKEVIKNAHIVPKCYILSVS